MPLTLAERFRSRFLIPEGMVYLDGNSLGPLSLDAEAAVVRTLAEWRTQAIYGWTDGTHPWLFLAERVAAQLALLVGAAPESVCATGSITVNLHQLLATLYDGKKKALCDTGAFPSDRYALQSHLRLRGLDPTEWLETAAPDEDTIEAAFATGKFSVAVLPSVVYTSGRLLDLPRLTAAARAHGVTVLWDLAHSIGIVPHALDDWGCDGAFWCNYKWLSGGPGAVGGLYLNPRHHDKRPGLAGWFGSQKATLFDNADAQTPADGAARLQLGTTHVLSLAPVEATAGLVNEAGIVALRRESLLLTAVLGRDADAAGFKLVTPRSGAQRGGHITIRHPHAAALCRALRREGIVPDHRPPDLIRLAPSPLFNTLDDCQRAIEVLAALAHSAPQDETGGLIP